MNKLTGLTYEEAWRLFHYDHLTGLFTRKVARSNRPKNSVVGTVDGKGYLHVSVEKRFVLLHRLAWFMFFGDVPPKGIDHINNNKFDNRISNLRLANQTQNSGNISAPKHNTSGYKGVYWNKSRGWWQVQIKKNGVQTGVGVCQDKHVAAAWYNHAAREHFGDFAKLNEVEGFGAAILIPKQEFVLK